MLANSPSSADSRQLIGFGATACLAKHTEARDVVHAIYLASRGLQVLPPVSDSEESEPTGPAPLTAREADVLELLQVGQSNAEIAAVAARRRRDRAHARTPHLPQARASVPGASCARPGLGRTRYQPRAEALAEHEFARRACG